MIAVVHEARDQVETARGRAPADDGRSPLRRCIVTRRVRPRAELLRLVIAPDGAVVPDIEGRLPGRGLWISPDRAVIAEALRKNLIAKAARRAVVAPADLAERIEAGLARRCLDLIGLARRAGQATAGFEKVRAWLEGGKAALLVEASDGAADGRRKLVAAASGLPVIAVLSAAELAAALGRETAVHVALRPGRLAERLREAAGRLGEMRDSASEARSRQETSRGVTSRAATTDPGAAANAAGDASLGTKNDRNGK